MTDNNEFYYVNGFIWLDVLLLDEELREKIEFASRVAAEWVGIKERPASLNVCLADKEAPDMAAINRYISHNFPTATLKDIERTAGLVFLSLEDTGRQFKPHLFIGNKYHVIVEPDKKNGNLEEYGIVIDNKTTDRRGGGPWVGIKKIKDSDMIKDDNGKQKPKRGLKHVLTRIKNNGVVRQTLIMDYKKAKKNGYEITDLSDTNILDELERQYHPRPLRCLNPDCLKPLDKSAAEYKKYPFCNDDCKTNYDKWIEELNVDYPAADFRRRCKWCGAVLPEIEGRGRPAQFCHNTDHYKQFKDLEKEFRIARVAVPYPTDTDDIEEGIKPLRALHQQHIITDTELEEMIRAYKESRAASQSPHIDDIDRLRWLYNLYVLNDNIVGIDNTYGKDIQEKLRGLYSPRVRRCPVCGKDISDKNANAVCCSDKCRRKYNRMKEEKN